jgi:hypothetical protein
VRDSTIKAALRFMVLLASIPGASAQPGPNLNELPSGDMWPGGFVEPHAPMRAIPPTVDDDASPSPGNIQRQRNEFPHEESGVAPSQIKLDITVMMPTPRALAGRHHARRACR